MKKTNRPSVVKGLSLPQDLLDKVLAKAKAEERSFSFIVRRAIKRDLDHEILQPNPEGASDLLSVFDLARLLRCSARTIRRRASTPGDAIFRARSRINQSRPMLFCRSKIEELDRDESI
jgi:hypothetical protein